MNDYKNDDKTSTGEDWAIIPFDEIADEERWTKLASEMDALNESARSTEALVGAIAMKKELPNTSKRINATNSEDELYDPLDPF